MWGSDVGIGFLRRGGNDPAQASIVSEPSTNVRFHFTGPIAEAELLNECQLDAICDPRLHFAHVEPSNSGY
jgi:hypothetical protein